MALSPLSKLARYDDTSKAGSLLERASDSLPPYAPLRSSPTGAAGDGGGGARGGGGAGKRPGGQRGGGGRGWFGAKAPERGAGGGVVVGPGGGAPGKGHQAHRGEPVKVHIRITITCYPPPPARV